MVLWKIAVNTQRALCNVLGWLDTNAATDTAEMIQIKISDQCRDAVPDLDMRYRESSAFPAVCIFGRHAKAAIQEPNRQVRLYVDFMKNSI
ncbi:MAG: hypothetical protein A3I66_01155 [Burkholderiales bacterium RIFCSPLOWO2_02_FULL_57_36]|nr:MAG: hypothetical protein A3I66_01155 [Burkholderiales bacterium RIFCSPLOWO2_02_FULL_57_36]